VLIAPNTAKRQIDRFIAAAMLSCDDVIDHVLEVGSRFRKMAILAAVASAQPNKLCRRFVHGATQRREEPV
jgi:hypothetical protein